MVTIYNLIGYLGGPVNLICVWHVTYDRGRLRKKHFTWFPNIETDLSLYVRVKANVHPVALNLGMSVYEISKIWFLTWKTHLHLDSMETILWIYSLFTTLPRFIYADINIALDKPVFSNPSGTSFDRVTWADIHIEAQTGQGNLPFIAVDLESQYIIEDVVMLIDPTGKHHQTECSSQTIWH